MKHEASLAGNSTVSLLETLYEEDWVVITTSLEIANGRFIQPTGFPDIGPCIYRDKEGKRWCLVESEQSMANRLEAVCMKDPGVWVEELEGLPVIAVRDRDGKLLTTNLCEPHRIASSYIVEGVRDGGQTMKQLFETKLGLKDGGAFWPLDKRSELENLVFALDPAALLHGFQFVQWKFVGLRQTRLLHARLEAELAEEPEVHYGMVKSDWIEPESARQERANKGQSIAAKSRVVPKDILASFEIDVSGLKSLALDEMQKKFLLGLALWKVGALLKDRPAFDSRSRQILSSLRLRADCHLRCKSVSWSAGDVSRDVTQEDLTGALPQRPAWPDFETLAKKALEGASEKAESANSDSSEKDRRLYAGPLVTVVYERKSKKDANSAAQPKDMTAPEEGIGLKDQVEDQE
jgi:CRISPR-associated protein Csb1